MKRTLARLRRSVLSLSEHTFLVLHLASVHKVEARAAIHIVEYDAECKCPQESLVTIKGKVKNWDARWSRGDVCYVAYIDGEPVAHVWICHGEWRFKDEDPGRPLPARSAFLYDAMTSERWRGKGVYPLLVSEAVRQLCSRAHERLYALVDSLNQSAQKPLANLGFQHTEHRVRVYRLIRLLNCRRNRVLFQ